LIQTISETRSRRGASSVRIPGPAQEEISREVLAELVKQALKGIAGASHVIAVPPDITRVHSQAGTITDLVYGNLGERLVAVLPAIGTHAPMTKAEISSMYPRTPPALFRVHDWRKDIVELSRIPSAFIREVGGGVVDYDYPVQANRMLANGEYDAIISVGQVVPHEVVGMANHAKNIFVGTGGKEAIDKSHFLGAAYGMEKMMGRADTPVRQVLNRALELASGRLPPILWILTVMGRNEEGRLVMKGILRWRRHRNASKKPPPFRASSTSISSTESIDKAVVWLDPPIQKYLARQQGGLQDAHVPWPTRANSSFFAGFVRISGKIAESTP